MASDQVLNTLHITTTVLTMQQQHLKAEWRNKKKTLLVPVNPNKCTSKFKQQMTDLLVGSVSDLLQLSDEGMDHQRPLKLLLVTDQISMKLTPPGRYEALSVKFGKTTPRYELKHTGVTCR